ncbi:hypothetical protein PG984_002578 [Apiospora sp. TS-2023a]
MASYKPFSTIAHPYPTKASPNRNACAYETGLASARNAFVFIGGWETGRTRCPTPGPSPGSSKKTTAS